MQNGRVSAIESAAVLNGRYHVLRPVGRGGMGAVYEAIDLRLRNTVAVKKMTAEGPEAQRAFEREGRLLAMLRHRTLPVVIDYFVEDAACYLVMQFIEGEDLAALLRRQRTCSEKDVQRWAAEVLAALVYLHGLETPVVHRDIKPANIKLTPRGDVVLLDFGLAKGARGSETRPDEDQSIYGFTPNYAPPEQLQFRHTDARSDLYALGATLHHLVMGVAPPSAVDRSAAIGLGRPDPLIDATSTATVSEPFAALLRRAMAIDPVARFASASEMLRALTSPSPGDDTEPERPHGVLASPPPLRPATRARRLDAATPSRAELDRAIDLLVQIRFADSPLLGLEDWPTRRKPDQIEQASEPVKIEHAVDPATGRFLPARLRIKLVAPDFEIRGAGEQLIDVAPDEYSQRVAFLMTPRRIGFLRVNVEVYAADTVYLGAIAVESEVIADSVRDAPLCTADLVLTVAAAPPLVESTVIVRDLADVPTAVAGAHPAPVRPASASVHVPPADQASTTRSSASPRAYSKLRTAALALSAAAVVMVAIQVQQALNTSSQLTAPPAAQVAGPAAPPPSAPSSGGGAAPPTPIAPEPPRPPEAELPVPSPSATAPQSVAPAPTAAPPTSSAPTPKATPARPPVSVGAPPPARVEMATKPPAQPSLASAGVSSTSHPGVRLRVVSTERFVTGIVRVRIRITNDSSAVVNVDLDDKASHLSDAQGRRYQATNRGAARWAPTVAPGELIDRSIDFAVPDPVAGPLQLTLAPALPVAARFPSVAVVVRPR